MKMHLPGDIDVYAKYCSVYIIIRSAVCNKTTIQLGLSQHSVKLLNVYAYHTARMQRLLFNDTYAE
jgi:hypothetical protein